MRLTLGEIERVSRTRSTMENNMSKQRDEQTEVEAAKERLKRFCKRASECTNYHDPERLLAAKEGREYLPRSVWAELGRKFQII
jgi:hypothetical protein